MSFATSACLRKATGRAKSDVANKLVSMFLHELSRKVVARIKLSVPDPAYTDSAEAVFGGACCYCSAPLEVDRVAIEHLEGMNRVRLGLHIPGNVILACRRCNGEKRRDDQLMQLALAESGWESFVSHDSSRCGATCKTCAYWSKIWPDPAERIENLDKARQKITAFRARYPESLEWSRRVSGTLRPTVDSLYRDCQKFAADEIRRSVDESFSKLDLNAAIRQQPTPERL